jgi:hypothetical protein
VLSYAGDQLQVAIAILVYREAHSAFLTALTYLPPIAGGPLPSGLADLFPRRRVVIACDLLRIGTVGLMAIPACRSRRCARCCSAPCWPGRRSRPPGPRCCPMCCPTTCSCWAPQSATSASRRAGLARTGLYAVQGLGILAGGAAAQAIGAPLAVGLAGPIGLTAATMLAVSWTQLHGHLTPAQQPEPRGPRTAAC